MDFKAPEKTAQVVGADDYSGFEATVRISPIPFGFLSSVLRMMTSGDMAQVEQSWQLFADRVIVEWNLADDAGPIPPTGEGVLRADPGVLGKVMEGWAEVVKQPPLANGSPPDDSSLVVSARTNGIEQH